MNHLKLSLAFAASALVSVSAFAGDDTALVLASFERVMNPAPSVSVSAHVEVQADPLTEAISTALYGEQKTVVSTVFEANAQPVSVARREGI